MQNCRTGDIICFTARQFFLFFLIRLEGLLKEFHCGNTLSANMAISDILSRPVRARPDEDDVYSGSGSGDEVSDDGESEDEEVQSQEVRNYTTSYKYVHC